MSRSRTFRTIVLMEAVVLFIVCAVAAVVLACYVVVQAVGGEPTALVLLLAVPALAWASSRGWYVFHKVRNAPQPRTSSQA